MPIPPHEVKDLGRLLTGVMATHDSSKRHAMASSPFPFGAMPARSASAGLGGHRYDGLARTRPTGPRQDLSVMKTCKLSAANSRLPAHHSTLLAQITRSGTAPVGHLGDQFADQSGGSCAGAATSDRHAGATGVSKSERPAE